MNIAVVEHSIEEHHALDHASLCGGLPKAAVGLADGRPERLVVDVKHPPAMELARCVIGVANRRATSVLRKSVLFWPWTMPAKLQVLALDEDARVQEHIQQEPRLTLGEAERRDGFHALGIGQVDGPAVWRGRQRHRINSSMIRGCAVRRRRRRDRRPSIRSRDSR